MTSAKSAPDNTDSLPPRSAFAAIPRHIAVIMDGNGRWAQQRNQERPFGHKHGAAAVRPIIFECERLGVEVLTLYSFSTENWKRPQFEVDFLMELGQIHLAAERDNLHTHNLRFRHIGSKDGLPEAIVEAFSELERSTDERTGLTVALAMNYGSRDEITQAVRRIADEVKAGRLDPAQVTQDTITERLYTAGLPDPDLLIRTAGEMRISNYLLWQISYTELWVTDTLWPDFRLEHLHEAIHEYGRRQRRFGAV